MYNPKHSKYINHNHYVKLISFFITYADIGNDNNFNLPWNHPRNELGLDIQQCDQENLATLYKQNPIHQY